MENIIEELNKKNTELQSKIEISMQSEENSIELEFLRKDRVRLLNDKEELRRELDKVVLDLASFDEIRQENIRLQMQINTLLQENNELLKNKVMAQAQMNQIDLVNDRLIKLEEKTQPVNILKPKAKRGRKPKQIGLKTWSRTKKTI